MIEATNRYEKRIATTQMIGVIHHLRNVALRAERGERSDAELLEAFVRRRDEPALEALVRRHGPMVWGLCRRVLRDYHDAEDAFQATFLVLVRKAASIIPREMLVNWLYGVANKTALRARATRAKRRVHEAQESTNPEPAATDPDIAYDLKPFLDYTWASCRTRIAW